MRKLSTSEIDAIGGAFSGTRIFGKIIPGANWPGGMPGALGALQASFAVGYGFGEGINRFNSTVTGMSLGEAIHRSGVQIGGGIRSGYTQIIELSSGSSFSSGGSSSGSNIKDRS